METKERFGHQEIRKRTEISDIRSLEEIQRKRRLRIIKSAAEQDSLRLSDVMQFMDEEWLETETLRSQGLNTREIRQKRQAIPNTRRLRSLASSLGIAKLLLAGDWTVNRKKEIPESMAVIPFNQLMRMIAKFNTEQGSVNRQSHFLAVDMGCGNGEFCDDLRTAFSDLDDNQWEIFGYADKIYFTLNDLLKNLLNEKFRDDHKLSEFIDIISTLLIRKINYSNSYFGQKTSREKLLSNLPEDLDVIREIMPHLQDYIDLKGIKKLEIDLEFLSDSERIITPATLDLIQEYCDSPQEFVNKYFKDVLKELSEIDKERLDEIEAEIQILQARKKPTTLVIAPGKESEEHESEEKIRIKELTKEKETILAKVPSLSENISLYPHNIIIGNFDEFGEIFQPGSVHFGWSFRATSHLDDAAYTQTIRNAALSLVPGGVFLDDGKRESCTRYERLTSLKELQKELGNEYRIRLISQKRKANAVMIERGIIKDDGSTVYFSDKYGVAMLAFDADFLNVGLLDLEQPQIFIRNRIIGAIRKIIVPQTSEGLKRRMNFRDIHPVIEDELSQIFSGEVWHSIANEAFGSSADIMQLADSIAQRVIDVLCSKQDSVIKKLLEGHAIPVGGQDACVQTFPRIENTIESEIFPAINKPRVIPVSLLPRNIEAPTLEQLSYKIKEFLGLLTKIQEHFRAPPIKIIEFDDCFTNPLLIQALHDILDEACFIYGVDFDDLISIMNVSLKGGNFPNINNERSPLIIIGGSMDDAYEQSGELFTERVCLPLLEDIKLGLNRNVLGICYGSQVVLQAYGKLNGIKIETKPGALQYGSYASSFTDSQPDLLQELTGGTFTVGMTRGSYSIYNGRVPDDMSPIAFETTVKDGKLIKDASLPALGFSLLDGRVVTSQFHPELQLKNLDAKTHPLARWLIMHHRDFRATYDDSGSNKRSSILQRPFDTPHYLFERHFNQKGEGVNGISQWVEQDVGPVFLLNTLLNQARKSLKYVI